MSQADIDRIKALLRAKGKLAPAVPEPTPSPVQAPPASGASAITWNPEQLQAIEYGEQLRGFCLIGAAGTGKTTTVKEIATRILARNAHVISTSCQSRYLRAGAPAVAFVSFTNRAVKNIRRAVKDIPELLPHTLTIHKLLEFYPDQVQIFDEVTGEFSDSMRFIPKFNAGHTLTDLRLVIIDESSMVDTRLFKLLQDACPNATFIFIGDLNQLPPVFGDAILGFKLAELPVVELTRVYRQAMDSPIIAFQHNYTLKGKLPSDTELVKFDAALKFKPFKMKVKLPEVLCKAVANYLMQQRETGSYDENHDIVLIPYNKKFGTTLINQELAQLLGDKRGAVVHEVMAGFEKLYLAAGDLVIHDKEEYIIKEINKNPAYGGAPLQPPSEDLQRNGKYKVGARHLAQAKGFGADLDELFDELADSQDSAEAQGSHKIWLQPVDPDGRDRHLHTRGDLNALTFGYCITIHKSQGSEWRKVYLIMTNDHAPMLSRELLYTGMTRAREELEVIHDPQSGTGKRDNSVAKAVRRQSIPGTTWQEKVEKFKGKYDKYSELMASKAEE